MKNSIFKNKTFYLMLTLCLIVLAGAVYVAKEHNSTSNNSTKKNVDVYNETKGKLDSKTSAKATTKNKTVINQSKKGSQDKKVKNQKNTNDKISKQTNSTVKDNKANTTSKQGDANVKSIAGKQSNSNSGANINKQANDNSKENNIADSNTVSNKVNQKDSSKVISKNTASVMKGNAKAASQKSSSVEKDTVAKSVLQEQNEACMAEPIDGTLLTPYTYRNGVWSKTLESLEVHKAIDIKGKIGEPVKSADVGMVSNVFNDNKLGETVIIKHSNNLRTQYSNLDKEVNVKVGSPVSKGTIIGKIGNTARFECKDEPHLHFAVLKGENYVDPTKYFSDVKIATKYQTNNQNTPVISKKIKSKEKQNLKNSNLNQESTKNNLNKNAKLKKSNTKKENSQNKEYKLITDPDIIGD